jgi:multicomponent Na+:H+ antiporter subunit E
MKNASGGMLVPVGDSVTVRNTVAYALREAAESAEGGAVEPAVHFVFPVSWQRRDLNAVEANEAEELLDRVRAWAHEDFDVAEDEDLPVAITTGVIGADEFLFSPRDYADVILQYARDHGLDHVVLDPEFRPGPSTPLITPLAAELDLAEGITYEEAPVERPVRGRRLLGRGVDLRAFGAVFLASFGFYQLIGGFAGTFDLVTGAISAAVVAGVLSGITFDRPVRPDRALLTMVRLAAYVPYLLWEISKANLEVAYIVLHPSLPIDPSLEQFRPALPVGVPVTTLANSITLTPGTVTVDVSDREFHVHALTQGSRDSLYEGGLERAVRFVFFGRDAARIPSPAERQRRAADAGRDDDAESGPDTELESGDESASDTELESGDESASDTELESGVDPDAESDTGGGSP